MARFSTIVLTAWFLAAVLGAGPAAAYWTAAGSTTGKVSTGTLAAPTAVAVPLTSASNVPVSWSPSTGAPVPDGYYVTRTNGSGTSVPACGSGPGALLTSASCTDTEVPAGNFTYTVTAAYRSWTATSTASGTVSVLSPYKLAFATSPSEAVAGAPIVPAVAVSVQSLLGTGVKAAGIPVTLSLGGLNLDGARLSGPQTVLTDAQGIAVFAGLSVDKAGIGYMLTAASPGLLPATSSPFAVSAPVSASKLVITTPQVFGTASSSASIGPITVQLQTAAGTPIPAPSGGTVLTLSSSSTGSTVFSASSGGPATRTVTIPAGASATSFYYGDTKAGTPTLTASAAGLTEATGKAIVSAAAASRLVFTSGQVSGSASRTANLGPFTMQRQDAFGNPVTGGSITLNLTSESTTSSLFAATAGGPSIKTVTIPADSSTASFFYADMKAGTPTLTASGSGLNGTTRAIVSAAAPYQLIFGQQPGAVAQKQAISPAVTVLIADEFGNLSTGTAAVTVTVSRSSLEPSDPTVQAVAGVATFSNIRVNGKGSNQLIATAPNLITATSIEFTVN